MCRRRKVMSRSWLGCVSSRWQCQAKECQRFALPRSAFRRIGVGSRRCQFSHVIVRPRLRRTLSRVMTHKSWLFAAMGTYQYEIFTGSFLAWSIQRSTVCFEGSTRTSFRIALASAIAWASRAGLRYRSSFKVTTPAASKSSAYSCPIPLMRMRSMRLATRSSCSWSIAVFSASIRRPLRLLAISSNFAVVRIPIFFISIAKLGPRPSSSEIEEGMITPKPSWHVSDELAEAGNGVYDRVDIVIACLVAGIRDQLARNAFNLAHVQPCRHQPTADAHNSAHAGKHSVATFSLRRCNRFGGAGQAYEQGLHGVGRTFSFQEIENDPHGSFSNRSVNAYIDDDLVDELVHWPPRSSCSASKKDDILRTMSG